MQQDHKHYSVGMNPSPGEGELVVLFAGEAQPVSLHGIGPAIHDYYLIHTVLSGEGDFIIRDRHYRCGAGDTFIIFPDELFSYQADERHPWSYTWVAFVGQAVSAYLASIGASPEEAVIANSLNPNVRNYYTRLRESLTSEAPHELVNLEAGGWTRLLLREFGQANRAAYASQPPDSAVDRLMKQAIQYLTLQFTQPISIERMAGMLGYHRTHLCKLFRRSTGMSPMQYLLKIRMERAEQLLATEMTIDQVASSVGFGDALYFSRKFRKWSGQAPSEFRHALRSQQRRHLAAAPDADA